MNEECFANARAIAPFETDTKAEFEALEGRTLLSVGGPSAVEFVYVETKITPSQFSEPQ